ncbi:MAG: Crp/Fnr family transcriptional regulator [Acidimicrobiia bacterium]
MESPLLAALPEAERREFLTLAHRRRFAKGEVLFHEGDPGDALHILVKGHVAVRISTPLGDIAMLRILRPGEFFGELSVISPGPRNATAVALDPVETMTVHKTQLDELLARRPTVNLIVTEALATEIRRLAAALAEALYLPSDKRVLRRLRDASDTFGTGDRPADVVPLTQEELAQIAGVTRETANRILRRAEASGHLRMARGKVEIIDHDALARLSR